MSETQLFRVYSEASDTEPLTWWSAPGYDDARRRLLDLFDLVPAPYTDDGFAWWLRAALLAHGRDAEGEEVDGTLRENVTEIGQLLRAIRRDREGLSTPEGKARLEREHSDDDRVPLLAMLTLRILRCDPARPLAVHIGNSPEARSAWGPDAETFGRLWHTDVVGSAWTIVRAFTADMARWSYDAPRSAWR